MWLASRQHARSLQQQRPRCGSHHCALRSHLCSQGGGCVCAHAHIPGGAAAAQSARVSKAGQEPPMATPFMRQRARALLASCECCNRCWCYHVAHACQRDSATSTLSTAACRAPRPPACRLQGISDADVGTLQGVLEEAVQVSCRLLPHMQSEQWQQCHSEARQHTAVRKYCLRSVEQAEACLVALLLQFMVAGEPGDGHGLHAHHHGAGVGAGAARGPCYACLQARRCLLAQQEVVVSIGERHSCRLLTLLPSPGSPGRHRTSPPRWRCPRQTRRRRRSGGGRRRRSGWRRSVRTATLSHPRPLQRCVPASRS